MISNFPGAIADLQSTSILPAATGIMTTDMYPKLRSVVVGAGRVVGIAKGAGMVEPNLATMLVYILTDIAVPRDVLRAALPVAVDASFNCMTIDSDTSTSDTVVCVSSNAVPLSSDTTLAAFQDALNAVCAALCEDVVRNGEGVQHVMKVTVSGAPSRAIAVAVGKSVANSPLFKCAVAGNDPNVGRLVAAIGKCVGSLPALSSPSASSAAGGGGHDVSKTTIRMGGELIFADGSFSLGPETERKLVAHLRAAQLWGEDDMLLSGCDICRRDDLQSNCDFGLYRCYVERPLELAFRNAHSVCFSRFMCFRCASPALCAFVVLLPVCSYPHHRRLCRVATARCPWCCAALVLVLLCWRCLRRGGHFIHGPHLVPPARKKRGGEAELAVWRVGTRMCMVWGVVLLSITPGVPYHHIVLVVKDAVKEAVWGC